MLGCAGRQMKRQTSFADVFLYVASCERLPQHCAAGHRGGVQLSAHKLQVFFDRLLKIRPEFEGDGVFRSVDA